MSRLAIVWISLILFAAAATPTAQAARCDMPAPQTAEALTTVCCCPATCLEASTTPDLQPAATWRSYQPAGTLLASAAPPVLLAWNISPQLPLAQDRHDPSTDPERYLTLCTLRL